MQVPLYFKRIYETGKIGSVDRTLRAIAGAALIVIAFLWVSNLVLQVILWILGATLVLEGLSGWCPITFMHRHAASKRNTQ